MFDIADALKNFCAEHDGQMNFYPGYSGRGMYGKKCPAIVVNDDAQPFDIALALAGFWAKQKKLILTPFTNFWEEARWTLWGSAMSSTSRMQADGIRPAWTLMSGRAL